jgi:hypothetical protein
MITTYLKTTGKRLEKDCKKTVKRLERQELRLKRPETATGKITENWGAINTTRRRN